MSLKRSSGSSRSSSGGADGGAKVGRQELYDELKKLSSSGAAFTSVDVALATGAGEPQVSRAMLGLAAEGVLEKLDGGKYRVRPNFSDLGLGEFVKIFNRAAKTDSTRQRDLSDITRLKQNNDIMRGKLLAAIAERDHYLAALRQHNIDPGPLPAAAVAAASPTPDAPVGGTPAVDAGDGDGGDEGGDGGNAGNVEATGASVPSGRSPNDPPTGLA